MPSCCCRPALSSRASFFRSRNSISGSLDASALSSRALRIRLLRDAKKRSEMTSAAATEAAPAASAPSASSAAATTTSAAATAADEVVVVTWDIDGTILHAKGDVTNKLHHRAFSHAWRSVFGIDFHIRDVPHQGSTDPLILLAGVRACPDTDLPHAEALSKLREAQDAMISFYEEAASDEAVAAEGLALLPGVRRVLEALSARQGVIQGLVTGNLEPIGWKKVETLGVAHHFDEIREHEEEEEEKMAMTKQQRKNKRKKRVGGFGSDYCSPNASAIDKPWHDRARLLDVAAERALLAAAAAASDSSSSPAVRIVRRLHVGDTPNDLAAAAAVGAVPVGVATGIFTREELVAAAVPGAVILDDLSDLEASLKAMGF